MDAVSDNYGHYSETYGHAGGNTIAQFVYDGDGNRVQSTINGVTTQFVGEYYEVSGTDVTKYYSGQTAMRVNGTVSYLLADHPGRKRHGIKAKARL